jgi:hypothetical protein
MRVETIQRLPLSVIACDKREAFAQGSEATKQSTLSFCRAMDCFASLAMTGVETNAQMAERL